VNFVKIQHCAWSVAGRLQGVAATASAAERMLGLGYTRAAVGERDAGAVVAAQLVRRASGNWWAWLQLVGPLI